MKVIKIENLTVTYDLKPVLWNINLEIKKGVLMCIVGPNGAGKSTLIKTILGLNKPLLGSIKIMDKNYKKSKKEVAYIPQKSTVDWTFPTTVYDVVLMGRYGHLGWFKRPTKEDKNKTLEAIAKVSMQEFSKRQISELSGGQQQRVFLARSLVQEANIYLMDEPFQGVDIKTEQEIIKVLQDLKAKGKTIIVVHHDLETVKKYFDFVALINKELITFGKVDEVFTKENIKKTYQDLRLNGQNDE